MIGQMTVAEIIKHSKVKSAPLRARDLRANIQELGFEKGVEMTLTLLLDEWVGVRQQLLDMANIQAKTIDALTDVTNSAAGIAEMVAASKRKEEQFDANRGEGILPSN